MATLTKGPPGLRAQPSVVFTPKSSAIRRWTVPAFPPRTGECLPPRGRGRAGAGRAGRTGFPGAGASPGSAGRNAGSASPAQQTQPLERLVQRLVPADGSEQILETLIRLPLGGDAIDPRHQLGAGRRRPARFSDARYARRRAAATFAPAGPASRERAWRSLGPTRLARQARLRDDADDARGLFRWPANWRRGAPGPGRPPEEERGPRKAAARRSWRRLSGGWLGEGRRVLQLQEEHAEGDPHQQDGGHGHADPQQEPAPVRRPRGRILLGGGAGSDGDR